MAFNKGQLYEQQIFNNLKKQSLIPSDCRKVESIKGQDVTVENSKGRSGIEIKLSVSEVDFGSGTLGFDFNKKSWFLKSGTTQDYEIIKEAVESVNLIEEINEKWYYKNNNRPYYEPQYLEEERSSKNKFIVSISRDIRGKVDQEILGTITKELGRTNLINKYYLSRGSNYIHIKNSGLYILGDNDPLGIKNKVSKFSPSKTSLLVRVQPKGSGRWRFAVVLKVSGLPNSIMRLGLDGDLNFLK